MTSSTVLTEDTGQLVVLTDLNADPDPLLTAAEALTDTLGCIPSRNVLMQKLHVGVPRANRIREQLITRHPDVPVSGGAPATYPMPATYTRPDQPGQPAEPVGVPKPHRRARRVRSWPLILIALPAFVAIWSGWVGLGGLTGFGIVHPFPGIDDGIQLNTAITLPIGVEVYAAYAIRVWLSPWVSDRARKFARRTSVAALVLGAGGQIAYHLMAAAHMTRAPWEVTTAVSALPVAVVFAGSALAHLVHKDQPTTTSA